MSLLDGSPTLRSRLSAATAVTGGAPLFPLAILFFLYFFDQFDTAAFGVLAPDIEKAFHLSDTRFGFIVILNVTVVLLLAVPVGHLGDRLRRTPMVVAAGILAGIFSLLTGVVGSAALLLVVRIGNGVGQLANGTLHNSLLADYYEPDRRPAVFSIHQRAVQLAAIFGTGLAGAVAAVAGWRVAFAILVVPVTVVSVMAMRLREPPRGGGDPAFHEAGSEAAVTFKLAARTLWNVPTLKRQYVAWLFVGAGVVPLAYIMPLYFQRAYGVGDFGRGLIGAVDAAFTLAGVVYSARLTTRWAVRDQGGPLRGAGAVLVVASVGLLALALAPDLGVAVVVAMLTSFVSGLFYVPFYTVQAAVSPPSARTLSYGFGAGFLIAGTWLLFLLPGMSSVSTDHGIRWGLGVLAPYFAIGGLILASAWRTVAADADRALNPLVPPEAGPGRPAVANCISVSASYGQIPVLFGVDLDVPDGEIVGLLGTNGAGKSTVLRVLSGLLPVDRGRVFFEGRDITHLDPVERVKAGLVMVPGGRGVFPSLTVAENLRLAGWLSRHDPDALEVARRRAFELFPVLAERLHTRAGELSGGEQQMLCVAQALFCQPRLLLIDELSLGLAPAVVATLLDAVRQINDAGTTVVVVEQSVNLASTVARQVNFMEKGQVRFSGLSKDLVKRKDLVRSIFLGGRSRPAATAPVQVDGPVVLAARGVTKSFGGVRAVEGVDLEVPRGSVTGIIGSNGAGKTTFFDLCTGFLRPDSGTVEFMGADVTGLTAAGRARMGLGRTFQDARLFPSMTVAETIATALERHIDVRDPVACLARVRAVVESEEAVSQRVDSLIDEMGLTRYRDAFVSELSTGTRRIVELACAVAHEPEVLLLDEPSSGIAQAETEALGHLLLEMRSRYGMTLVVIEHDIPLVSSISDRLVCMHLGQVIATGVPKEVLAEPAVVASYLGTDQATIARSGRRRAVRAGAR